MTDTETGEKGVWESVAADMLYIQTVTETDIETAAKGACDVREWQMSLLSSPHSAILLLYCFTAAVLFHLAKGTYDVREC